jgi:hypothetical protein
VNVLAGVGVALLCGAAALAIIGAALGMAIALGKWTSRP